MLNSYIKPMLLNKKESSFNDDNYIFEWKVDGVRCIAHIDQKNKMFFLHSRHGKNCTIAFPGIAINS
jgi:ATP-dependent DNA ligase